jgi:hypothetical protein
MVFLEMLVDENSILVEQFYGNSSLRCGCGNRKTGLHVLNNLERCTTNRDDFYVFGRRCSSRLWFRFCFCRRCSFCDCGPRCGRSYRPISVPTIALRLRRTRLIGGCSGTGAVRGGSSLAVTQQFTKVGSPGFINQFRIAAETTKQSLDVGRICAEVFSDYLR